VRAALQRYECVAGKSGNEQQAAGLIEATAEKAKKRFKETVFDGGMVNGKAKKLVKPRYPARAAAIRLTGRVEVQVTIDETGRVIFACAQRGHPFFFGPSEEAALKSTFLPTLVNGKPVKLVGLIVYNFVP